MNSLVPSIAPQGFSPAACPPAGGGDYHDYLAECEAGFDPDLWLYRERTVALLRRYLRSALEVGRVPSLLGRELFPSKLTGYEMANFEDGVIFVHDVERALDQLSEFERLMVAAIIFYEFTHDEATAFLRCGRRTISREFPVVLDRLTELFLAAGLLYPLPPLPVEKVCQEGSEGPVELTDCKQGE